MVTGKRLPAAASRAAAPANRDTALALGMAESLRHALFRSFVRLGDEAAAGPAEALTVAQAAKPTGPARLAARHPPGPDRVQALARYTRCLAHYRQQLRPEDTARGVDDIGVAAALFVAANLGTTQAVALTPLLLQCLAQQLGSVVRHCGAWSTASTADHQSYAEQLAVVAVLVGESWAQALLQGEAAQANVQRAARGYLVQLLGVDADQLALGPGGLVLREPNTALAN